MSSKAETILALLKGMQSSNAAYYANASEIWTLLSEGEQTQLNAVFQRRFPIWRYDEGKEDREALLTYKLITWAILNGPPGYGGDEGYVAGTFNGYAVWKSHAPKPSNVTLPGETRKVEK